MASPTWIISGSGGMTARVASSTNIAWWQRFSAPNSPPSKEFDMSDQAQLKANKRLAREYIQRVFNEHCPDLSTEYVTDDVVWHGGILGDIAGAGNVVGLLSAFIGALPDLYAAEQGVAAENDLVMVRLVVKATQKGDLLGVPPAAPRSR